MKGISATGNFVLTFTGRDDELEEVITSLYDYSYKLAFWGG